MFLDRNTPLTHIHVLRGIRPSMDISAAARRAASHEGEE